MWFLALLTLALPLVEVPAKTQTKPYFAVMVSGDGGWAKIDKAISEKLAADGVSVVGLNALQYFWKKREPEAIAHDIASMV